VRVHVVRIFELGGGVAVGAEVSSQSFDRLKVDSDSSSSVPSSGCGFHCFDGGLFLLGHAILLWGIVRGANMAPQ
jgi:hypothetical protein